MLDRSEESGPKFTRRVTKISVVELNGYREGHERCGVVPHDLLHMKFKFTLRQQLQISAKHSPLAKNHERHTSSEPANKICPH